MSRKRLTPVENVTGNQVVAKRQALQVQPLELRERHEEALILFKEEVNAYWLHLYNKLAGSSKKELTPVSWSDGSMGKSNGGKLATDMSPTEKKLAIVTELLDILNTDYSAKEKISEFMIAFIKADKSMDSDNVDPVKSKSNREILEQKTDPWQSFQKKVWAILSCVGLVGIYKACTSYTYFGASHGEKFTHAVDKIYENTLHEDEINSRGKMIKV